MILQAPLLPWWRRDRARWVGCAALVVMLHAGAGLALVPVVDEPDPDGGVPVVMIELAPIAAAPTAAPTDLAPGPPQVTPEREAQPSRPAELDTAQLEEERKPEPPPPVEPAVTLPAAPEKPLVAPAPEPEPEETPVATAPPSAPTAAPRPRAGAPGRLEQAVTPSVARWQTLLVAHLNRHKRYPAAAGGRTGTTRVAFTIDHDGRLIRRAIAASSGSDILDQEALSLLARAQPLPAPPADVSEASLSFVVPIRFTTLHER